MVINRLSISHQHRRYRRINKYINMVLQFFATAAISNISLPSTVKKAIILTF